MRVLSPKEFATIVERQLPEPFKGKLGLNFDNYLSNAEDYAETHGPFYRLIHRNNKRLVDKLNSLKLINPSFFLSLLPIRLQLSLLGIMNEFHGFAAEHLSKFLPDFIKLKKLKQKVAQKFKKTKLIASKRRKKKKRDDEEFELFFDKKHLSKHEHELLNQVFAALGISNSDLIGDNEYTRIMLAMANSLFGYYLFMLKPASYVVDYGVDLSKNIYFGFEGCSIFHKNYGIEPEQGPSYAWGPSNRFSA